MAQGWRKEYSRYQGFFLNIRKFYQRADIKLYLELLLTLTAVSVFSIFALRPTIITITELNKEIKAKEDTVSKMNAKLENLQRAQIIFSQEQSRLNLLDMAIPNEPQPDRFVRQIEGLSTSSQSGLENLSVSKVILVGADPKAAKQDKSTLPQGIGGYDITVYFNSPFDNLTNALSNLESMRRPLIISSISLTTPSKELGSDILDLTLTAKVPFYEKPLAETPTETNTTEEDAVTDNEKE